MKIAVAISVVIASLHFVAAADPAEAKAVVRGNNCFSGVSSDEKDAKDECEKAGMTCTAPKVMSCYFDNGRHMYICQCKVPPKKPKAHLRDDPRYQSRPAPQQEYQLEPKPNLGEEPKPPSEPQLLNASAENC